MVSCNSRQYYVDELVLKLMLKFYVFLPPVVFLQEPQPTFLPSHADH